MVLPTSSATADCRRVIWGMDAKGCSRYFRIRRLPMAVLV